MPVRAKTLSQIQHHTPKQDNRPSASKRGYGARWQKARKLYLTKWPLCVECYKENMVTIATIVDHITPHKGDYKLFWDQSNWQGLCKMHHDIKTATEDGGFGRKFKTKE